MMMHRWSVFLGPVHCCAPSLCYMGGETDDHQWCITEIQKYRDHLVGQGQLTNHGHVCTWIWGGCLCMMYLLLIDKLWPRPPEAELQSHLCSEPATCSSFWGVAQALFWTASKSIKRPTHSQCGIDQPAAKDTFFAKNTLIKIIQMKIWFYKYLNSIWTGIFAGSICTPETNKSLVITSSGPGVNRFWLVWIGLHWLKSVWIGLGRF